MEWSPHRAFPQDLHTLHHSLLLLPLEPRPESKDHPGSLYISHNYHNSPIIMNLTLVPNSNLVGIPVYPIFRQSYDFWTYWFQFGVYPIDKHLCLFLPSEEQNLWICLPCKVPALVGGCVEKVPLHKEPWKNANEPARDCLWVYLDPKPSMRNYIN
jgi:hypothetical protein